MKRYIIPRSLLTSYNCFFKLCLCINLLLMDYLVIQSLLVSYLTELQLKPVQDLMESSFVLAEGKATGIASVIGCFLIPTLIMAGIVPGKNTTMAEIYLWYRRLKVRMTYLFTQECIVPVSTTLCYL